MSKSKPQIKIRSARRTKECHYVDDLLASRVGRDLFHLACEDAEDELGVPCWRIPLARLAKHQGKRLGKFDLGTEDAAQAAKAAVEAMLAQVQAQLAAS